MVFICHLDHSVAKYGMYSICNLFLKNSTSHVWQTFVCVKGPMSQHLEMMHIL